VEGGQIKLGPVRRGLDQPVSFIAVLNTAVVTGYPGARCFYRRPEHRSCHGIPRSTLLFCTIKL